MGCLAFFRTIGDELRRMRHFRGHGVHSPYIYRIKREVFMRVKPLRDSENSGLVSALEKLGVSSRLVAEIYALYHYCGDDIFVIDPLRLEAEARGVFVVLTQPRSDEWLESLRWSGTTVAVLGLRQWGRDRLDRFIANHPSTTVERRDYLLIFNNHLPKQHFIL